MTSSSWSMHSVFLSPVLRNSTGLSTKNSQMDFRSSFERRLILVVTNTSSITETSSSVFAHCTVIQNLPIFSFTPQKNCTPVPIRRFKFTPRCIPDIGGGPVRYVLILLTNIPTEVTFQYLGRTREENPWCYHCSSPHFLRQDQGCSVWNKDCISGVPDNWKYPKRTPTETITTNSHPPVRATLPFALTCLMASYA